MHKDYIVSDSKLFLSSIYNFRQWMPIYIVTVGEHFEENALAKIASNRVCS